MSPRGSGAGVALGGGRTHHGSDPFDARALSAPPPQQRRPEGQGRGRGGSAEGTRTRMLEALPRTPEQS